MRPKAANFPGVSEPRFQFICAASALVGVPAEWAQATIENGQVRESSFRNVPSFLYLQDQLIDVPEIGTVRFDVAYGGADNVIAVKLDSRVNALWPPGKTDAPIDFQFHGGLYRPVVMPVTKGPQFDRYLVQLTVTSFADQAVAESNDIQAVIGLLEPLPGSRAFLDELRSIAQVIILSDTFEQFAQPLMRQLGWPTLFCHRLLVENDRIVDYQLRMRDQKRESVAALKALNYRVISAGDSYNDTSMLGEADRGFLIHAPDNVKREFPQFTPVESLPALLAAFKESMKA